MSENIIAIINYNFKNYCIYQIKDKIEYALLSNGKLDNKLDNNEVKTLNEFYNLIRYNKEYSVFCGCYKIGNKDFEIFQDTRSTLYTFVERKNNKRYIPSKEDIILLNSYFNNEKFVHCCKKFEKESDSDLTKKIKINNFLNKVLVINGVFFIALISSAIVTYNLPQSIKSNIDYEFGRKTRSDVTLKNKTYEFEDIVNAVDSNPNISEEDKSFIKEVFEEEFEDNKNYMDIELVMNRLRTLRIKYDRYYTYNKDTGEYEVTHGDDVSYDTVGLYYDFNNTIMCLESPYPKSEIEKRKDKPFGFNEFDKSTYYHEMNHAFTKYDLDSVLSATAEELSFWELNDYVRTDSGIFENITDKMQGTWNTEIYRETINEIFTQEYIDEYYNKTNQKDRSFGYCSSLPYMYCLAEILPKEVLREYKFNDNDSIITEGLLNISDNKEEAYKLTTSLKSIYMYENLVSRAETNNNLNEYVEDILNEKYEKKYEEEVKQAKIEELENYKRIHDGLAYFYKEKYNKDMSDDMNMLIYLYNTPVITKEEKQKVIKQFNILDENEEIQFIAKGYFSKYYMERHPNIVIRYVDKDYNKNTIEIKDNNRYLEDDNYQR